MEAEEAAELLLALTASQDDTRFSHDIILANDDDGALRRASLATVGVLAAVAHLQRIWTWR